MSDVMTNVEKYGKQGSGSLFLLDPAANFADEPLQIGQADAFGEGDGLLDVIRHADELYGERGRLQAGRMRRLSFQNGIARIREPVVRRAYAAGVEQQQTLSRLRLQRLDVRHMNISVSDDVRRQLRARKAARLIRILEHRKLFFFASLTEHAMINAFGGSMKKTDATSA